jgi:ATP-dependent Lon protease
VWAIGYGGQDENPGLYRIEVNESRGSGVRIVNKPAPGPFRESVKCSEKNLSSRANELIGDRDPSQHEFTIQLLAVDAARSGASLGVPVLLASCSALLKKSLKGGLIVVGGLNLGGGIDPVYNVIGIAELAIEKGANVLLIPISARRQLNDLPDDLASKLGILYYVDIKEALVKALSD